MGLAAGVDAALTARALGAWVNVPAYGVTNLNVCDSGWLPATGAADQSASETSYYAPGTLYMDHGTARGHSHDNCDNDDDAVVDLGNTVLMPGYESEVSFGSLKHRDHDECCNPGPDDYTATEFTDLMFAGMPVTVTGLPDQEVVIAGVGTLVLNERRRHHDRHDCDDDAFIHNSLHLYLAAGGEIIAGSTIFHRDDNCCGTPSARPSWGTLKIRYR